ncbi:MAG: hypothetical protein WKF45_06430 [Ilumatobacteraceae bacterium]
MVLLVVRPVIDPVLVDGGLADLHVRREHRIRWREHGAEQGCARRGEAEGPPTQHRARTDAERQRHGEQAPRRRPATPPDRPVDGQSGTDERDEDADLGEPFGRLEVLTGIEFGERRRHREQERTDPDEHERQRQGALVEERRQPGGNECDHPEECEAQFIRVDGSTTKSASRIIATSSHRSVAWRSSSSPTMWRGSADQAAEAAASAELADEIADIEAELVEQSLVAFGVDLVRGARRRPGRPCRCRPASGAGR